MTNLFSIYIGEIEDVEYSNSIATASGITSYSRAFMSTFKNNHKFNVVYTDTDSIMSVA